MTLDSRHMKDSFICIEYDFISDESLREAYIDVDNGIRISKLLSDMDAVSGIVAYKHYDPEFSKLVNDICDDYASKCSGYTHKYCNFPTLTSSIFSTVNSKTFKLKTIIVTASVDRIIWIHHPSIEDILKLYGMVTFVGNSSMEVTLFLSKMQRTSSQKYPNTSSVIAMACFTMVARNRETRKADPVPRLLFTRLEERECYELSKQRRSKRIESLSKSISDIILVKGFTSGSDYKQHAQDQSSATEVPMSRYKTRSTYFCHPQDKNIHGVVFGGYLMRIAYEACFSNACIFAKQILTFVSIDEIEFKAPVPIGSTLILDSEIVHVDERLRIHVAATAQVSDSSDSKSLTNTFHFVFQANSSLPKIFPQNEDELALKVNCVQRSDSYREDDYEPNFMYWSDIVLKIINGNNE